MKAKFVVVALALMVGCAGAWARGHGHGHGGARLGVYVGGFWGPWWGPSAYYYNPPVVVQQPIQIEAPAAIQAAPTETYWYFCRSANAYYPYVKNCPGGWERVSPTPPQ
ncbi:MAG: hypothetical protein LBP94_04230 [Zoogloeaceae bacterium]|jgi:hypothetical protein|nr:hypothetical protein [Zoogloeaceae bacterium]